MLLLFLGVTSVRSAEAARKISVCVMDEASQCVEPESLIPLKLGFKKLVMVGDHEQLQVCSVHVNLVTIPIFNVLRRL